MLHKITSTDGTPNCISEREIPLPTEIIRSFYRSETINNARATKPTPVPQYHHC
jgi:hypothetical protein